MLRFRLIVSAVPLLMIGLLARGGPVASPQLCLAAGDRSVQLAATLAQAQIQIGFTDDPRRASVRVQIVDAADDADFVVIDDAAAAASGDLCKPAPATTTLVAITPRPAASDPVIHLTRDGPADYRIFVGSKMFTAQQAAALLIAASDHAAPLTTAAIAGRS